MKPTINHHSLCRLILLIVFIVSALSPTLAMTYSSADSLMVERLLRQAPADADVLYFARQFTDVPYVAHTLEVNDDEQLVVNTRQLDCTTFVENVVVLQLCALSGKTTFTAFTENLKLIRYRGGCLDGYISRLHYFSDWIEDNTRKGIVRELQQSASPFTAEQCLRLHFMSQHPQSYKALKQHPSFVKPIARQEQLLTGRTYRYIPKEKVVDSRELRRVIHDGDILAITTNKSGLDIAHLGFAVWRHDGLHLLNASQLHKKVIEEPLTLGQYLQKHPTNTGIRVVRLCR